ncbi:glutathione peroxidase-like peroxiredoxin Hyr1p [Monosporozyma unispora]|nr:peroxiredoxin hyr1 [Kazachstania unispora]
MFKPQPAFKASISVFRRGLSDFYNLSTKDINGKSFPFKDLKGKTVLIVNVASKCGFTKQYDGLENLYNRFKDKNFTILGFPCNQFGKQEPGSPKEIQDFVSKSYGVTFPIMTKINVNGSDTNPIYEYLKNNKSGALGIKTIKWNFEKFLVNKEGKVVQRYSSLTEPNEIVDDIENIID